MYKPKNLGSGNQAKKPNQAGSALTKTPTQYGAAKPKEERFNNDLFNLTKNLINLKLNDPEFDELTLELPRGQIWRQEDNLHLLNIKLHKLVEILQREESEVKFLEDKSEELKEELATRTKANEEAIETARQQLQDQLERHGQLVQEKEHGRSQNQNVGKELQAKEEAILELNKNIQQLMSDFLAARDRNDNVEDKLARIKEARKLEEEELKGPRPGSIEYEEKMNRIWALERVLKEEEEIRLALDEENEHLKQQLKELAPHSVLSPDDKSPQKAGSLVDLEKYADMKPEDIHRDIENLRNQAYRQQDIINQLETQNKDDIEAINVQKSRIEDMRSEYVKYMDRFQRAQREKDEALNRHNEVEGEGSVIMQKFNNVSILLGKDVTPTEQRQSFGEIVRSKPRSPTFNPQPNEQRAEVFGSRYENREVFVPTPSTLKVLPSNRETKENVRR